MANQAYNEEDQIILVTNQEICGEFRVALIEELSIANEFKRSKIDFELIQNVIINSLHIEFQLELNTNLRFNIVDMNGKIVQRTDNVMFTNGLNQKNFELSHLSKGTYILQLIENGNKSAIKMFIKQ